MTRTNLDRADTLLREWLDDSGLTNQYFHLEESEESEEFVTYYFNDGMYVDVNPETEQVALGTDC